MEEILEPKRAESVRKWIPPHPWSHRAFGSSSKACAGIRIKLKMIFYNCKLSELNKKKMQSFLKEDEARAAILGSKKKVVAMAEGRQYTVIEVRDDQETRWLRMVGEEVSVKDRLFLKIGNASAEEVNKRSKQVNSLNSHIIQ